VDPTTVAILTRCEITSDGRIEQKESESVTIVGGLFSVQSTIGRLIFFEAPKIAPADVYRLRMLPVSGNMVEGYFLTKKVTDETDWQIEILRIGLDRVHLKKKISDVVPKIDECGQLESVLRDMRTDDETLLYCLLHFLKEEHPEVANLPEIQLIDALSQTEDAVRCAYLMQANPTPEG
jgi:hypothetical protein